MELKNMIKPITDEQKKLDDLEVQQTKEIEIHNKIYHIMEHANIPKRYKDAKPEPINEMQTKLLEKFKECFNGKKVNEMKDLLILGNIGTGKTHLTIGVMNNLIKKAFIYCRYATEYELLALYFEKKYDAFNRFKNVSVLVIDEIGKRKLEDWQKIVLEELISHRYNEMLPTIFISNLNTDEFKAFMGDRVTDRLKDNQITRQTLMGESLRGKI